MTVVLTSIDIGVCIGRAWEGVYESDYNKIDTSYEMLGEAIENFVLTVSSLILDNYLDFEVSGKILDAISWLKDYSKRLEEK